MKIMIFCALGLLVGIFLFVWLVSHVRYRIGSRHLKVVLFGLPLRRVLLTNIESISKRRSEGLAEHWWSTMSPKHRMLVIRRRRGLCRNFVITPKNRYIFRADLERAMDRAAGKAKPGMETQTLADNADGHIEDEASGAQRSREEN
jgi:hypothetical protein